MISELEQARKKIGAKHAAEDTVTASSIARLAATLDVDNPAPRRGDIIPAGWHAIFCTAAPRPAALSADGLPAGDDLLPELSLPRRMFGGARLKFIAPIQVGDDIRTDRELADLVSKPGKAGDMVIATVRTSVHTPRGLAIVEDQDVLYLGPADPNAPPAGNAPGKPAPAPASWSRTVQPDVVMLFRYSALTFNSHRVHYDKPFVTGEEKRPDLLVQGKLTALMLLELARARIRGAPLRPSPTARFVRCTHPRRFMSRAVRRLAETARSCGSAITTAGSRRRRRWSLPEGHPARREGARSSSRPGSPALIIMGMPWPRRRKLTGEIKSKSTASGTPSGPAASRTRSKSSSRSPTCCSCAASTTCTRSRRTSRPG